MGRFNRRCICPDGIPERMHLPCCAVKAGGCRCCICLFCLPHIISEKDRSFNKEIVIHCPENVHDREGTDRGIFPVSSSPRGIAAEKQQHDAARSAGVAVPSGVAGCSGII